MTYDEFEEGVSRYGGDLDKWPAAMRAAATAAAKEARTARLLAEAERLDRLIGEAAAPAPLDAARVGAIVAGIGNGRRHDVAVRPTGRLVAWSGAAMVAFLAIGFVIGLALPADQGEATLAGLAFGVDVSASTTGGDGVL